MNTFLIEEKIERIVPFWLGLLFFLGQISTSLKSIPLVIVLLSLMLLSDTRQKLIQILKTPWCQAALMLFLIAAAACFWGPATLASKLSSLKQYNKILYLPFLAIALSSKKNRSWALAGFLFAMALTALFSIILYLGLIQNTKTSYDSLFFNHIMTGFAMSFAAFLAMHYALRTQGILRLLHLSLFLLFTYHIFFINLGRSGYVIYVLMLGLLATIHLNWRQIIIAFCFACLALAALYSFNSGLKARVDEALFSYQHYDNNKNTSVGFRMQFHEYARELFKRHPMLGNGTASFPKLFYNENPVPEFGRVINEPHNMYWFVASEFGLIGVLALLGFFVSLLIEAFKLREMKIPAVVLIVSFMAINCSDSLLFYSGSGYLFIFFVALCFGERVEEIANCEYKTDSP